MGAKAVIDKYLQVFARCFRNFYLADEAGEDVISLWMKWFDTYPPQALEKTFEFFLTERDRDFAPTPGTFKVKLMTFLPKEGKPKQERPKEALGPNKTKKIFSAGLEIIAKYSAQKWAGRLTQDQAKAKAKEFADEFTEFQKKQGWTPSSWELYYQDKLEGYKLRGRYAD